MSFLKPFLFFLIINFAALGIGSWLMGNGSKSDWYLNLNKAPWTPDGWVFGAAWATIMICFAVYIAFIFNSAISHQQLLILFGVQLFLNIIWNFIFFNQHRTELGLVVIISLTVVVSIFLFKYWPVLRLKSLLILPYVIWLLIATSLNAYIVFKNQS